MTIPLQRTSSESNLIKDAVIAYDGKWKDKYIKLLQQTYARAPYKIDVIEIAGDVFAKNFETISELNIYATELVCKYFDMFANKQFLKSSDMQFASHGTEKLVDIVNLLKGKTYITGHGALNYLNYDLFETNGIRVEYIDYAKTPYRQDFGEFTPYVSILDLIANEGKAGKKVFNSPTVYWKEFTKK